MQLKNTGDGETLKWLQAINLQPWRLYLAALQSQLTWLYDCKKIRF